MKKNWVLIPLLLIVILLVIPWMLGGWSVSNGWSEIVDKSQDKPEFPMAFISILFYLWWQDTNRRNSKQD
ncbi:MAG: hypothetical protein VB877_16595 [Pirellulaceae bacterium]